MRVDAVHSKRSMCEARDGSKLMDCMHHSVTKTAVYGSTLLYAERVPMHRKR